MVQWLKYFQAIEHRLSKYVSELFISINKPIDAALIELLLPNAFSNKIYTHESGSGRPNHLTY